MMFSRPRTNNSIQQNSQTNYNIQRFNLYHVVKPVASIPEPKPTTSIVEVPAQTEPGKKKMKWGEPVWFFFHTMAEKVNPDSFLIIRAEFFQIINRICRNLPCPTCSQHAGEYLNKTNLSTIQTKEQLIEFFYLFHNEVNKKKGFQEFPRELLHDKYSKAITLNIINNFLFHFLDKSFSIRMIAEDFHRKRLVTDLKTWLNSNLQHFSL